MNGGSAENASLQGCNLVEQRRGSCRGAILCRPKSFGITPAAIIEILGIKSNLFNNLTIHSKIGYKETTLNECKVHIVIDKLNIIDFTNIQKIDPHLDPGGGSPGIGPR